MQGQLQGLGPFRLTHILGEGEYAIVYEATREGDGLIARPSALKVLREQWVGDTAIVDAFSARAAAALPIVDPSVVQVRAIGDVDGRPWVELERVEGVALADLLPKKGVARWNDITASTVLDGLLRALSAAAKASPGLTHGRVDASNILIDVDGDIRVHSFGAPAEPQADLLSIARLAQRLCKSWPEAVDGWIDLIQSHDATVPDVTAAHEAFPGETALAGKRALARSVKRLLKKRAEALAEDADAPKSGSVAAPKAAAVATREPVASVPARAQTKREPPNVDAAARQARWLAWACAAILAVALVVEVVSFGPS